MKIRTGNKKYGDRRCYAYGGRVEEDISDAGAMPMMKGSHSSDAMSVDGDRAKSRMDRAGKKPASTNVNIIVTSGKSEPAATPAMPMPPAPMGPPAGPMPPMPNMPMRASGGRVNKATKGGIVETDAPYNESAKSVFQTLGSTIKRATKGKEWRNQAQNSMTGVKARWANEEREETEKAMEGRKSGGRVMAKGEGSGGGLGRLDKAKMYGAKPAKGK